MAIAIKTISYYKELHCHYDGQTNSQDCYIELDCENETLSASYNGEIGNAIPFSVYHGHNQRFGIPCLLPDAVNGLMKKIKHLADRVVDGYESHWDGNNNVARFDDDAKEAIEEIQQLCDDAENDSDETNTLQEWDAGDWLGGVLKYCSVNGRDNWFPDVEKVVFLCDYPDIDHTTTDDELDDIIEKIEDDAESDNVVLNELRKLLYEARDMCKENFSIYNGDNES